MPEHMLLEVLSGTEARQQIAVPPGGVVLGRGLDCDVTLNEPTLSRKHCRFALQNGEWVVQDLGSRSGVIVNTQIIDICHLKQGDELILGNLRLKVTSIGTPQTVPAKQIIRFNCQCGKVHVVKASLAGKTAVCGRCGAKMVVPATSLPNLAPSVLSVQDEPQRASRDSKPEIRATQT